MISCDRPDAVFTSVAACCGSCSTVVRWSEPATEMEAGYRRRTDSCVIDPVNNAEFFFLRPKDTLIYTEVLGELILGSPDAPGVRFRCTGSGRVVQPAIAPPGGTGRPPT